MTTWNESIKIRINTENEDQELEFETDGEQQTYIYLKPVEGPDEQPRKYIGSITTVDFVRIMARALDLWRDDAEEAEALETESTNNSNLTKGEKKQ